VINNARQLLGSTTLTIAYHNTAQPSIHLLTVNDARTTNIAAMSQVIIKESVVEDDRY
jgi:hypothetical protein